MEDGIYFRLYDHDSVDENACKSKADFSIHNTDHISETCIEEKSADEQQNGMAEFFRTLLHICCEENCTAEKLTEALLPDSVVLEKEEVLLGLIHFIESAVNGSYFLQGSDNSPQSWKNFFHCLKVLITSLKEYPEKKTVSRFNSYLAPQGTQQPITESTRDSFVAHSFGNPQEAIISHGENESFEGIGGETSISDVTELAAEMEELQHQNKKLLEENQRFRTQVSATEEMCQQLSFENEELSQKIKNLQTEVERLKDFEIKNEELKMTLLSVEKSKKNLMAKFTDYEDHERELKNEMIDLQKQLASSRGEADHKKQLLADLLSSLCEQKQQNDELYREKIELRSELCEKSVKCEELEAAVRELSEANKSLRSDNNFKDSELMKAKEEMSCLLERMKHFVTLSGSGDSPNVRMACTQEKAPFCHASKAVSMAHASSSEFSLLSEQSIHSEMYSMISSSEGFSTPVCGRDSLPFSKQDVLLSSLKKRGKKVRDIHKSYSGKKKLVSSRKKASVKRRKKKYHSGNSAVSKQSESSLCDANVKKETSETDSSAEDSPKRCFVELCEQKELHHKKSEQNSEMVLKDVFLIYIHDQMELQRRYIERANLKTEDSLKLKFDDMQVEQTLPSPQIPAIVDVAAKDIHTQIGTEIQALKAQLIRSHALLSYLQSKGTLPYREAYFDSFIQAEKFTESQHRVKGHLLQQRSLDEQTAFPCHLHSKKNSSVTASNKSTPLHNSYFAQSCPVLLGGLPVTSKAIQADLLHETSSERPAQNCTGVQESTVALHRLAEGYEHLASEERRPVKLPSVPETTSKSAENLECYVCEAYTDENGPLPRLRTNSFLTAVKSGSSESFESYVGLQNGSQDKTVQSSASALSPKDSVRREQLVGSDAKRMEANENVQLQGSQKPYQTSSLVQKENESCLSSSTNNGGTSHATSLKEKSYKVPQRSFRRGSGAGSPNSLSCIPRYPAFDFSEQDEDSSTTTSVTKQVVTFEKSIEQSSKLNESAKSGSHVTVSVPVCKEMAVQKCEPGKSTMLMPEPVENSETESAKGSFEYEAPEAHVAPEAPPLPVPETAFPNLPDTLLLKLGIKKDGSVATDMLGDQELESKFMTLALAFKTDKMTLPKRLEIQKRQRDIAEQDVENEIRAVRESLNYLNTHATSSEMRDLITKLQNHIDIVRLATSKVSARSETYGAVKQEERVSCAFEVMMLHVENLKRLFDKEHRELEETKQLLSGTQAFKKEAGREGTVEEHRRSLKTFGMAIGSIKSVVRRRASVAEFCHFSAQGAVKPPITSSSLFTPNGVDSKSRLFSALSPFTSSHSLDVNRSSLSSPSYNPCSWSPNQVNDSRRCSLPTTKLAGSAVPSQSLGPKRMEALQLKKSSSDLKISMVPSLSPVVDEELYENETAETEDSENGLNADSDSVQNVSLHHEHTQENQSFVVNSDEEQNSDTADCTIKEDTRDVQDPPPESDVLKSCSLVERLGYMTAVQDIWATSSFLTLFRYAVSFLFGLTAVVMLLFSCVPSKVVQK